MRFGAPRSSSPSPVRGRIRRSTYGLRSRYEDSDSDVFDDSDTEDSVSSSSSEDDYTPEPEHGLGPKKLLSKSQRSPEEMRQLEETIASIRLRTRHHDPYEEWEKQTRKEAFMTARKEQSMDISGFHELQERHRAEEARKLAVQHEREMAAVQAKLNHLRLQQQEEERKLRDDWDMRQKRLWARIEMVIRQEEDKVAKRLADEQKKREEEERKRQEEELKRRLAEEKRRQEEERRRMEEEVKKRVEEEKKKKEEEEERLREEEERQKRERLAAEKQQREHAGLSTAEDDWKTARRNIKSLKSEMASVKANKQLKVEWGKWRRQIKPKIGQLTNDPAAIDRISQELLAIIQPPTGPHHPQIYLAILCSLAKDILLQAEIETTAEKHSAGPLAQVTFNILSTVGDFAEVFFAKLVQRVGGWPIPQITPSKDFDGREWVDREERIKVMGFRKSGDRDGFESEAEFTSRAAGIMRIYFSILKIVPMRGPLKNMFQLPRYWTWFARLLGERALLETVIAAQVMYTALDVMGHDALRIWGAQWVKMLALIYEGVTVGIGADKFIGGISPEGKAARVRVQLEIERIMSGP